MKIYQAPMEGLTGYVFRQTLLEHFGGIDKYFTPFITPSTKAVLGQKILQDILPENNKGQRLVPQILTNDAEGFLEMCQRLEEFGYTEFNLNLGCPSGTVVSKGRGAGFLAYPEELDRFLDKICKSKYTISVKTRLGISNPEEFLSLIKIYSKYPINELIIHPRTRTDMYKNNTKRTMYNYAKENYSFNLCYNGDIFDIKDFEELPPYIKGDNIMLGRGLIINPMLAAQIKGEKTRDIKALKAFVLELMYKYEQIMPGQVPYLHKMKELLTYIIMSLNIEPKMSKAIKKSKTSAELEANVVTALDSCELKERAFLAF